ncbi:hypothetical protein AGMMS49921_01580 [Endomicrobiia bacterium]|nr:hypothetical protein AGMMS49921_01580 [Endomicrobiia bacterium]
MIRVKFLGKHKRIRNILLILAMCICSNSCSTTSYYIGKSISQNDKKNFDQIKKKAKQGDAKAQYELGVMYEHGKGIKQDFKKAFYWYKMSAEQGNPLAKYNLGLMYEHGKGVKQDYKEAFKWYKEAADQGIADAQAALTRIIESMQLHHLCG